MNRNRPRGYLAGLCLLGWACAAAAAQPACAFRQEALADPAVEAGTKDESRITLLAVDPPGDNKVRESSIVEVDVEYHVAGFQPQKHELSAQFFTLGSGTISISSMRERNYLESATGRVRLCVPLRSLYPNDAIRWPLTFEVLLHEMNRRSSNVLAKSATHTLYSSDTPAAALARQASLPSQEYQAALLEVFGFFETQDAIKDVCGARFADLAELAGKYAGWREPNAAFIDRVSKEQMELYRMLVPGNDRYAVVSHGRTREIVTGKYQDMPDFALRRQCDAFVQALGTVQLDPEARLADPLAVLRDPKQKNPTDAI
jgi:hypothetical protein